MREPIARIEKVSKLIFTITLCADNSVTRGRQKYVDEYVKASGGTLVPIGDNPRVWYVFPPRPPREAKALSKNHHRRRRSDVRCVAPNCKKLSLAGPSDVCAKHQDHGFVAA